MGSILLFIYFVESAFDSALIFILRTDFSSSLPFSAPLTFFHCPARSFDAFPPLFYLVCLS